MQRDKREGTEWQIGLKEILQADSSHFFFLLFFSQSKLMLIILMRATAFICIIVCGRKCIAGMHEEGSGRYPCLNGISNVWNVSCCVINSFYGVHLVSIVNKVHLSGGRRSREGYAGECLDGINHLSGPYQ